MTAGWEDINVSPSVAGWENLYVTERTGLMARAKQAKQAVYKGVLTMGTASLGLYQGVTEGIERLTGEIFEIPDVTGWIGKLQEESAGIPVAQDTLGKVIDVLGQALPIVGASILSFGTGGIAAAGALEFAIGGGNAYAKAKARGASEGQAQAEMALVGSLDALISMVLLPRFMKFAGKGKHSLKNFAKLVRRKAFNAAGKELKNFTGQIAVSMLSEGVEEFAQEGVEIVIPGLVRKDWPKTPEGKIDYLGVVKQMAQAGMGGALAGGFYAGVGSLFAGAEQFAAPTDAEIEITTRDIQNSKLPEYEKAALVTEMNKLKEVPAEITKTELQKDLDDLGTAIDEVVKMRPEQRIEIKEERAKRFEEVRDVLNKQGNAQIRLAIARKAASGRLLKQIDPLLSSDKWTEGRIEKFYDAITQSKSLNEGEVFHAEDALNRLFKDGAIPSKSQIEALEKAFGKDLAHKLVNLRKSAGLDKWNKAMEIFNLPRALLASMDLSASLRQGLLFLPLAPKVWAKGVGHSIRMFLSEDYYNQMEIQIKTHPYYGDSVKDGVELTQIGALAHGEEMYQSHFAERIPVIGNLVRRSEVAFAGGLNYMRAYSYYHFREMWEGTGKTAADRKSLAKMINHLSGRGNIKWLEKHLPAFDILFFAPRFMMSSVQVFSDLYYTTSPVRKLLAGTLMETLGGGMALLSLASLLKGVDVEPDPRSTDFGKIKVGNTRINIWSHWQPMFRYLAQFTTGQGKNQLGEIYDTRKWPILARFIQSKLSPAAGAVADLVRGENFLGKKLKLEPGVMGREAFERFMPMFIQDVVDAARYQGVIGTGLATPSALFGVGVISYPTTAQTESMRVKDNLSRKYFGEKWDKIGPVAQKVLRTNLPQINLMEIKARMERENYGFMERIAEEEADAANNVLKALPRDIRDELARNLVRIPGLSRRINSDWFLNKKRYKEYQKITADLLKKILPIYINDPEFQMMPADVKREMLNTIISTAKKAAREKITRDANISDMERLT